MYICTYFWICALFAYIHTTSTCMGYTQVWEPLKTPNHQQLLNSLREWIFQGFGFFRDLLGPVQVMARTTVYIYIYIYIVYLYIYSIYIYVCVCVSWHVVNIAFLFLNQGEDKGMKSYFFGPEVANVVCVFGIHVYVNIDSRYCMSTSSPVLNSCGVSLCIPLVYQCFTMMVLAFVVDEPVCQICQIPSIPQSDAWYIYIEYIYICMCIIIFRLWSSNS